MKSFNLSASLFTFFFLLTLSPVSLLGQSRTVPDKWIGIHNLYYQNKTKLQEFTYTSSTQQLIEVTNRDYDHAISFGLYFRLINENKSYHHFDVFSLDLATKEILRVAQRVGSQIYEPTRGSRVETTTISLGYQRGKMFPLLNRLMADVSVAGHPTYRRTHTTPLTSAGFPTRETWQGLGLSVQLGLNYQVHRNFNVGYNFSPLAGQWWWYEIRKDNPILTENQKITKEARLDTSAFENVLGWQNIHIRYVIKPEKKRRKRRKRRR